MSASATLPEPQVIAPPPPVEAEGETRLGLEAPAGNPRYPYLDALRAIAALSVLFAHVSDLKAFPEPLERLLKHGNVGVVIFFLISGFLLYRPFVTARSGAPAVGASRFYTARILRIVPAYWVALTVLAIWPGVGYFGSRWWQLYLFGQIYDPKTAFGAGIGPAWSLCVEVSFYLLLPLYAYLVARMLRGLSGRVSAFRAELVLLAVLALISVGTHVVIDKQPGEGNLSLTLPGSFYLFAVGMAVAVMSTQDWWGAVFQRFRHWAALSWVAALAIYAAIAFSFSSSSTGSVNPAYVPVALLLLLPAVAPARGLPTKIAGWGVLRWVGAISYALYLWHQTLVKWLSPHLGSAWTLALVGLTVSVAVAALSYYFVEQPFLRIKARLRGSRVAGA